MYILKLRAHGFTEFADGFIYSWIHCIHVIGFRISGAATLRVAIRRRTMAMLRTLLALATVLAVGDAQGLTVVIVGGNQGLGFATAQRLLAEEGAGIAELGVTARSEAKAKAAVSALSVPDVKVSGKVLDLTDLATIDKAVEELPAGIDRLLLNAGGLGSEDCFVPQPAIRGASKE